jgi:uncharacterized repeat protein (TIGR01451 family)
MKSLKLVVLALSLVVLTVGQSALAAKKGSIELRTEVQKIALVKDKQGKQVRKAVPAGKVTPGDELVYTIYFKNVGKEPVGDIVIKDPVPEHTVYKDGTAFGAGTDITFSVDGGKTYATPSKLMVSDKSGKRRAKASEYTNIRWVFKPKLAPGKQGVVHFRAILK